MKYLTLAISIALTLIFAGGQRVYVPFNCKRVNSPCAASFGGQCLSSGGCQCTNSAFSGYNCALRNSQIVTVGCTVNCANNGVCYNDGGGQRCFCPPAYYGETCALDRVDIIGCNDQSITVMINPHQTGLFNGRIYVRGYREVPACSIDQTPTLPFAGFTKTLSLNLSSLNNPCAGGILTLDGGRVKRYSIIVQHSPTTLTATDELHTIQCTQAPTGQFVGIVVNGVQPDPVNIDQLTGKDVNLNYVPLQIRVTRRPSRNQPTTVLRVSDDLYLEISLTATSTHIALRVDTLTAYETNVNPQSTMPLIVNGCPVANTNGILDGDLARPQASLVLVPFKMFKFVTTNSVYFYAETTLCTAADVANCNPRTCNNVNNGFGRRKRQADGGLQANATTRVFVVTEDDPLVDVTCERGDQSDDIPSCFRNTAFLITVVIFGLLLLVAVVILVMICVRVKCRRQKSQNEPQYFTNPALTKM